VHFIGIDLGWKMNPPRDKGTAICLLTSRGRVEKIELVTSDEEIIDKATEKNHTWLGIDAPLIIPDRSGLRECERTLFSKGIRLLPTNRVFFERKFGGCRGETIALKLLSQGFKFPDQSFDEKMVLFEIYPYGLLHIVTNGNVPSYKRGDERKRRKEALRALYLAKRWEPSLEIPSELKAEINCASKRDLASVMDKIDALLGAVCVYSHWRNRGRRTESIGNNDDGFILLPKQEAVD
jgi:predicted RNase H-like nuclease